MNEIDIDKVEARLKELERKEQDNVVPPNYDPYLRESIIQLAYVTIDLSKKQEALQKRIVLLSIVTVTLTAVMALEALVELFHFF